MESRMIAAGLPVNSIIHFNQNSPDSSEFWWILLIYFTGKLDYADIDEVQFSTVGVLRDTFTPVSDIETRALSQNGYGLGRGRNPSQWIFLFVRKF